MSSSELDLHKRNTRTTTNYNSIISSSTTVVSENNDDSLIVNNNKDDCESSLLLAKEEQNNKNNKFLSPLIRGIKSIPAVILLSLWNIMLSVPFGSTFFSNKITYISATQKQRLGLQMSLFSLTTGQGLLGGCFSSFSTISVWPLAEVAPYFHTFADIASRFADDEDPSEIYSTTMYLISLSSIMVGVIFLLCGKGGLGKVFSFLPTYVTLGLIGGIGVWASIISISVSLSENEDSLWKNACTIHFGLSVVLTVLIRCIRLIPKEKIALLDPLYYLSIPVLFYIILFVFHIKFDDVVRAGYVFQDPQQQQDQEVVSQLQHALELWTIFDISKVKWNAAFAASPSILAAGLLGIMITIPFISPIADLLGVDDFKLDKEFTAHGITNIISGLLVPGGMASVECYSSTNLYHNSGGGGAISNFLVTAANAVFFVYGHTLVGYLPRCTAGSILLDIGITLTLEAVGNSGNNDLSRVEYTSIWVIILAMNAWDMTAGLIAALFMALLTSTLSSADQHPIRKACNATMFPSSKIRKPTEENILDRKQIAIFQLQGSIFFGNISKIDEDVMNYLSSQNNTIQTVIIFDFTLVQELDSSACVFFNKIQTKLQKKYSSVVCFVADKSKSIKEKTFLASRRMSNVVMKKEKQQRRTTANTSLSRRSIAPANAFNNNSTTTAVRKSSTKRGGMRHSLSMLDSFIGDDTSSIINGLSFNSLDEALRFSEELLLTKKSTTTKMGVTFLALKAQSLSLIFDLQDIDDETESERSKVIVMLKHYCCMINNNNNNNFLDSIADKMKREVVSKGTQLWKFGDNTTSARLLLSGSISLSNDDNIIWIKPEESSFIGLRGLILGEKHVSTAYCEEDCVFYVLEKGVYEFLSDTTRILEVSLAKHLSHSLNHVSNRIYDNNNSSNNDDNDDNNQKRKNNNEKIISNAQLFRPRGYIVMPYAFEDGKLTDPRNVRGSIACNLFTHGRLKSMFVGSSLIKGPLGASNGKIKVSYDILRSNDNNDLPKLQGVSHLGIGGDQTNTNMMLGGIYHNNNNNKSTAWYGIGMIYHPNNEKKAAPVVLQLQTEQQIPKLGQIVTFRLNCPTASSGKEYQLQTQKLDASLSFQSNNKNKTSIDYNLEIGWKRMLRLFVDFSITVPMMKLFNKNKNRKLNIDGSWRRRSVFQLDINLLQKFNAPSVFGIGIRHHNRNGLSWLFTWIRGGMTIKVPIFVLKKNTTDIENYVCSSLYFSLISFLLQEVLNDVWNSKQDEKEKDTAKENTTTNNTAKADAEAQRWLMMKQANSRRQTEIDKNGLVITKAMYYISTNEDRWDVTTQLQFWTTKNSTLTLPALPKQNLLGFYDIRTNTTTTDNVGGWKEFYKTSSKQQESKCNTQPLLAVQYDYDGISYEIVIQNEDALALPSDQARIVVAEGEIE